LQHTLEYNALDVYSDYQFIAKFGFTNVQIVNTCFFSFTNLVPTFIL